MSDYVRERASLAKAASHKLRNLSSDAKNTAIEAIANALWARREDLIAANKSDMERSVAEGISEAILGRLKFDEKKIEDCVLGLRSLTGLQDPVGKVMMQRELDEGLVLSKISCPLGVVGIVFEARPDAFVQISSLCLKSANAVLLKGGKEAALTNSLLFEVISKATEKLLPNGWISLLESREEVSAMLKLDEYIDLIIPRGSNSFVKYVMDNSSIPVLGHADGICHIYLHEDCDFGMAAAIVNDAKTQYVSACNTVETLLVNRKIAADFLPLLKGALAGKVELRGDAQVLSIIDVKAATDSDWACEYGDYILSIKIVEDLEEAITHINKYSSSHTDSVITASESVAERFFEGVDSANVFWNASTRFSDGFRYGFGAEVGISTSKIHARGPVGLEGLLTYQYRVRGKGQIVSSYAKGEKHFTHRDID